MQILIGLINLHKIDRIWIKRHGLSDSEAVTRIRTEILDQLHKSKDNRLNAIIKRQVILKQCEKVCSTRRTVNVVLFLTISEYFPLERPRTQI